MEAAYGTDFSPVATRDDTLKPAWHATLKQLRPREARDPGKGADRRSRTPSAWHGRDFGGRHAREIAAPYAKNRECTVLLDSDEEHCIRMCWLRTKKYT